MTETAIDTLVTDKSKIFICRIKGTGMSALRWFSSKGLHVQGSDVDKYFFTQRDLESGIKMLPFAAKNIQPGMVVIAGNAFPDTHENWSGWNI